jgi:peptide/nickel transport system permease protein
VIQRIIEILRSLPELPLWLALSAALPANWSPILVYFGITIILGLLEWPGLARAVRSKLLSLRQEDYAVASRLMGAKPPHIIGRHLLPNFMSHLIASATLAIPAMISATERASWPGLRAPARASAAGEAQNIESIALYPWLLFHGQDHHHSPNPDGLRDAADPTTDGAQARNDISDLAPPGQRDQEQQPRSASRPVNMVSASRRGSHRLAILQAEPA